MSDRELDEITEVRGLLETPVVADQAGRLGAGQLTELGCLAEAIVAAARRGDTIAYIDADMAFHLTLLRWAGNMRLVEIVADLRSRTRLNGLDALVAGGGLVDSAQEHVELVALLAAGDRQGAADLMRRHLRHVRGIWAARPES